MLCRVWGMPGETCRRYALNDLGARQAGEQMFEDCEADLNLADRAYAANLLLQTCLIFVVALPAFQRHYNPN